MIWQYKEIKNTLQTSKLITLNEGNTPELKFLDNNTELTIKREDLNPTGSWKDRGTAYKISELVAHGQHKAVIASSGNAAISFLEYSKLVDNFVLTIVLSNSVNTIKLNRIKELIHNTNHQLVISDNPRKTSVEISAKENAVNLRASIDESIVKGYWSLGIELKKHIIQDRKVSIISPVSSGTAFIGMVQGLQMKLDHDWQLPRFVVAQTSSVHPIVDIVTKIPTSEEASIADAIVDKTALRAPQISKVLTNTNGLAFAISNQEIINAREFAFSKTGIEFSNTSLLSVAAYLRLKEQNDKLDKAILIASGT